jgi:hypothetical protein
MAPQRLRIGKGAGCSVLVKYLRPSKEVGKAIVNPIPGQCLDDLVAMSHQETQQKDKRFRSIFSCSDTIPGVNLYAAAQWVAVKEGGDPNNFWDEAMPEGGAKAAAVTDNEEM